MPVHHGVFKIKSLQVANGSGLYFLWETKMTAQLRDLGDVEFYEELLLICIKEQDIGGRSRLYQTI